MKDSSKVVRSSPMRFAYRFFEANTFYTPGGNCVTLKAGKSDEMFSNSAIVNGGSSLTSLYKLPDATW